MRYLRPAALGVAIGISLGVARLYAQPAQAGIAIQAELAPAWIESQDRQFTYVAIDVGALPLTALGTTFNRRIDVQRPGVSQSFWQLQHERAALGVGIVVVPVSRVWSDASWIEVTTGERSDRRVIVPRIPLNQLRRVNR